jgi:hypothetical protein
MAAVADSALFQKIIVFLAIYTLITGVVNTTWSGGISASDIALAMGSDNHNQNLPGQAIPVAGYTSIGSSYRSILDFSTLSGFDPNFTVISSSFFGPKEWERIDGSGYLSDYATETNFAYIDILGVQPSNGVYDVTYSVFNQFREYPLYTLVSGVEVWNGRVSGFYVKYDQSGISAVRILDPTNPLDSIAYPYANLGQTIRTVFNPVSETVDVYIDNNSVGTLSGWTYNNLKPVGYASTEFNSGTYNAGIAASHAGLNVYSIESNFELSNSQTTLGILEAISGFASLIASALGITGNPLIPFWFNLIVLGSCTATLVYLFIKIIRGN